MNQDVYAKQLMDEMKKSAQLLNSRCIWMGYRAGLIPEGEAGANDICKVLRKISADVVITHWKGSYHPRHVLTHQNVLNGCIMSGNHSIKNEYQPYEVKTILFGENMEDQEGFTPDIYVDTTVYNKKWLEALNSYQLFREHVNKYPYKEFYTSNSILRGIEVGVNKAKAFMLQKSIASSLIFPNLKPQIPNY